MRKTQPGSVEGATSTCPRTGAAAEASRTTRAGPRATPGQQPVPRSTAWPRSPSTTASGNGRARTTPWVTKREAGVRVPWRRQVSFRAATTGRGSGSMACPRTRPDSSSAVSQKTSSPRGEEPLPGEEHPQRPVGAPGHAQHPRAGEPQRLAPAQPVTAAGDHPGRAAPGAAAGRAGRPPRGRRLAAGRPAAAGRPRRRQRVRAPAPPAGPAARRAGRLELELLERPVAEAGQVLGHRGTPGRGPGLGRQGRPGLGGSPLRLEGREHRRLLPRRARPGPPPSGPAPGSPPRRMPESSASRSARRGPAGTAGASSRSASAWSWKVKRSFTAVTA